jgi:toxin FitB
MYLLDTNVVSELRKAQAGRADAGVVEWARSVPSAFMFVSVVTLYELEYGVLLAERSDPTKGALLRAWLDTAIPRAFEGRVLAVDTETATRAATYSVPDPAPFRDSLIAATAAINGLSVVTRNVADYARIDGLPVHNPWD